MLRCRASGLPDGGASASADLSPAKPVDSANAAATSATVATEVASGEGADVGTKKTREHVEVGEIAIEEDVPLTAITRGAGPGGSKYKFHDLRVPVKKADGTFSYASFRVDLQKGVDEDALKRSVQSANTQENSKNKDQKGGFEGSDIYYLTRQVTADGKFTGIRVYRVDGTIPRGK